MFGFNLGFICSCLDGLFVFGFRALEGLEGVAQCQEFVAMWGLRNWKNPGVLLLASCLIPLSWLSSHRAQARNYRYDNHDSEASIIKPCSHNKETYLL